MTRCQKFGVLQFGTVLTVLASLAATDPAAAAPVFSNIYVFGDSLTDSGNARTGALGLGAPDPAPPGLGYYNGRFSNGPVWVDYLSQDLGFGLLSPSLTGGTNYAMGGARAVTNADFPLDLAAQLGMYMSDLGGGPADPNALYVLNFGGNDTRDILHGTGDAPDPASIAPTIVTGIQALNAMGARYFLISNIPDIGLAPEQNGAEAEGRALSLMIGAALNAALDALTLEAGTTLFRFDSISLTDAIVANPAAYGFTESVDAYCLAVAGASPDCDGFLFFDPVHPTTAGHRLIADAALAVLNATQVPEPAAIALLGLGAFGAGLGRRGRARL